MASIFIPKPEDQRLVWKRATREVIKLRVLDRMRSTSGVEITEGKWEGKGCENSTLPLDHCGYSSAGFGGWISTWYPWRSVRSVNQALCLSPHRPDLEKSKKMESDP